MVSPAPSRVRSAAHPCDRSTLHNARVLVYTYNDRTSRRRTGPVPVPCCITPLHRTSLTFPLPPRPHTHSSPAGSALLTEALASPAISHITVLTRRAPLPPNPTSHPKLRTVLLPSSAYPDGFASLPPELVRELQAEGHSACIWAQGISQSKVSEDEYVR
jgi:hypothetical protein